MRPSGTERVICIAAKLTKPLPERSYPCHHYISVGKQRPQDRELVTDRHLVLTILRVHLNAVIHLPYQVQSIILVVFVIIQAYTSLSVPSLFKIIPGATRCGFG